MASLDELIAQIPIRHNLFSYLIFTGVLKSKPECRLQLI